MGYQFVYKFGKNTHFINEKISDIQFEVIVCNQKITTAHQGKKYHICQVCERPFSQKIK